MSNCTDAAAADAGAAAAAVRLFSFWALFRRLVAGIIPKCAPSVLRQDQSDSVTVLPLSRGFGLFSELFAYLAGIHRTSSSMESSTAFHSWRIVPGWITISLKSIKSIKPTLLQVLCICIYRKNKVRKAEACWSTAAREARKARNIDR